MKKTWWLLLWAAPLLVQAQIGGRSTFQFLNTIASARVAGQGGQAIANTEADLNFALINPALAREEMSGQITSSAVDYVSDIRYGDVAYAHHWDSLGTFFMRAHWMDYGDFQRANIIGERMGEFSAIDYAFHLGYSYRIDSNWRLGASLKYIGSQYDIYSASGLAFDAGILYEIHQRRLAFALSLRNMGWQLSSYAQDSEALPFEIQFGVSNRFEHMPLRWMITLEQLETFDLRYRDPQRVQVNQFTGEVEDDFPSIWNNMLRHVTVGAEFSFSENFNLQFGYSFRRRQELNLLTRRTTAGFSLGGGLKIYKFNLHYSRNFVHIAGSANHLTISTQLDRFRKNAR